jgi:hypothetical protein
VGRRCCRRCHRGQRGAWPLPGRTRLAGSRRRAVMRYCRMARRFRCGPAVAPSGRQPTPDLVGGPHRREYGGRASCGSDWAVPACVLIVEVVGAWQQAKGGDAWWAAGRRAGPGRSASSPERGSTRAAAAPAGPGPTTPVRAPRKPATGAAGRAAFTPAVLQPRRPAVPGARHRAAGGRAGPAVVGQGDGQAPHCPGWGVAMTLTAAPRRPTRRGDGSTARASRLPPSVATVVPDPLR